MPKTKLKYDEKFKRILMMTTKKKKKNNIDMRESNENFFHKNVVII